MPTEYDNERELREIDENEDVMFSPCCINSLAKRYGNLTKKYKCVKCNRLWRIEERC